MRPLSLLASCVLAVSASAQVAIKNPEFLDQWAGTNRFRLGQPTDLTLMPDGSGVLFLRSGPRSFVKDLYLFDVETGTERVVLTADGLLGAGEEQLTAEELARRERTRSAARGIASFSLSEDGRRILIPLSGRLFLLESAEVRAGKVSPRELTNEGGPPIDARFDPTGMRVGCVRSGDLYVIDVETGVQRRISPGASGTVTYGEAEFVAQEEMGRHRGYWFSPDGTRIAFQKTDTAGMEMFHIADAFRPERPPRAWPYPRAGKENAEVSLAIAPTSGGEPVWVDWDRAAYPYLASVTWTKGAPLTILVQNRTQTEQVLYAVDDATGALTELLRERDDAWINLVQNIPRWLPGGDHFLWMSEQHDGDGWQLQLRRRDGSLERVVIDGSRAFLLDLLHTDPDGRFAIVAGSDDPTQVHLWRVALRGAPMRERISPDKPGVYAGVFARTGGAWVRTGGTLAGELLREVVRADGSIAGTIAGVGEEPPFIPAPLIERVEAGGRVFFVAVILPRDFDPARAYPVINSVYGGPHSNTVNATARAYLIQQWLADQGFVVVSIDARGTPRRGRAWERAIRGDVITGPLEEHVDVLRALAKTHPEMDLTRVGITGWSFGGYFAAHAVMRRPDIFRAGVAGAPVADWRDYDTHYTERYMGLPEENRAGYERASVLTYCKDLSVPLLIIHGTADDNVYAVHSLRMTDALFRAGRRFEFIPLGGMTHAVNEPDAVRRLQERIATFFMENLGAPTMRTRP
jgi:dipeptidyl-peptidase-4